MKCSQVKRVTQSHSHILLVGGKLFQWLQGKKNTLALPGIIDNNWKMHTSHDPEIPFLGINTLTYSRVSIPFLGVYTYLQVCQTSVNDQIVNILGFANHIVSVATTQMSL